MHCRTLTIDQLVINYAALSAAPVYNMIIDLLHPYPTLHMLQDTGDKVSEAMLTCYFTSAWNVEFLPGLLMTEVCRAEHHESLFRSYKYAFAMHCRTMNIDQLVINYASLAAVPRDSSGVKNVPLQCIAEP